MVLEHWAKTYHTSDRYSKRKINRDYLVIKRHPFDKWHAHLANYVFTSSRDVEEIRASLERLTGKKVRDNEMSMMQRSLSNWLQYTDFHMPYEMLLSDKAHVIERIADVFGFEWNDEDISQVLRKVNSIMPPTDKRFDPVTMYFDNHISKEVAT